MSTSDKSPSTLRGRGGPGSSHQDASKPRPISKPSADNDRRARSNVSGGGGGPDSHHTHDPESKGGGSRPA